MGFSKIKELGNFDEETSKRMILSLSKELVELRIKKATRQNFKPHNFKHLKHTLSQLLTLKNLKKTK
jgi:large subunit ribosomal protein L29